MRVALLSDTHGFVDPRIADRVCDCDVAIHAGDVGGADVLLSLQPRRELIAVRGNNDDEEHWSEGELQMLATLPREAGLDLPGGRLVVVHGDDGGGIEQRHRRYRRRFAHARAVLYGHSHRMLVDCNDEPWILNPGAAGRTRTYGGPSCLFLDCDGDDWRVESLRLEPRRYPASRRRRHIAEADADAD